MNAAQTAEAEDDARLRQVKESLAHCRDAENEARRALARAVESTVIVKQKYEALFEEMQRRAVARRKARLIPVEDHD